MDRRGQGISINVIVIAAIALLILVILSVLVLRAGRTTGVGTSCEATGGVCREAGEFTARCDVANGETYRPSASCTQNTVDTPYYCCQKV